MKIKVIIYSENRIVTGNESAEMLGLSRLLGLMPDGSQWMHWQDDDASDLTWQDAVERRIALVLNPLLLQQVLRMKPDHIIALLSPCPSHVRPEEWTMMSQLLAAYADMVWSASERLYLEECFRREGVFYLNRSSMKSYGIGSDIHGHVIYLRDDEWIWKQAMTRMLGGDDFMPMIIEQWHARQGWYEAVQRTSNQHELIYFMLASYAYLLHEDDAATAWIQKACDVAKISVDTVQVSPYYRFLAAIAARKGHVEEALHYYQAMAHLPEERGHYEQLAAFYQHGEMTLLRARVLRLNEDHKYVTDLLRGV